MERRWKVAKTKSKRRWVAWRSYQKRKSGVVFESWNKAMQYAYLMAGVDRIISRS